MPSKKTSKKGRPAKRKSVGRPKSRKGVGRPRSRKLVGRPRSKKSKSKKSRSRKPRSRKSRSKKSKSKQSYKNPIKVKQMRGCERQTDKKYISRPSPPYPANECQGDVMEGNDGNTYKSKRSSNGVYRWIPIFTV